MCLKKCSHISPIILFCGFPLDPDMQLKQTGHLRRLMAAERPRWMYMIQIRVLKIWQNRVIWSESSVFDLNSPEWMEPACLVRGWRDEEIVGERERRREKQRGFLLWGVGLPPRWAPYSSVCVSVFIYRAWALFVEEWNHTGWQSPSV